MKALSSYKIYFALSIISIYMMALLSSLDSSLIFITLGLSLAFLVLGYQRIPNQTRNDKQSSWWRNFSEVFSKKSQASYRGHTAPKNNNKAIAIAVLSFVIVFFITIFSVIVFSDSDALSEEQYFMQQADDFRLNGTYDSATSYYQKVLALNPLNADAINSLGYILYQQENYDAALQKFEEALKIKPEHNDALFNKGLIYYDKHDYSQSLNYALQLIEINADYTSAMLLAGDDYFEQQNYDSSLYWYEQAYKKGVRSANLSHFMAYIYDQKGKTDDAVAFYKEALNYDSTKVEIYERLGELLPGNEGESYRALANKYGQQ